MRPGQVSSQDSHLPHLECQEGKSEGSDDILFQIWKLRLREAGGRVFCSSSWAESHASLILELLRQLTTEGQLLGMRAPVCSGVERTGPP